MRAGCWSAGSPCLASCWMSSDCWLAGSSYLANCKMSFDCWLAGSSYFGPLLDESWLLVVLHVILASIVKRAGR
jgi:hypothetical protein